MAKPGIILGWDSRFFGLGLTFGAGQDVPAQLQLLRPGSDVSNRGHSGRLTSDVVALLPLLLSPDANPLRSQTALISLSGYNDWNLGRTAAAVCADYDSIAATATAAGIPVGIFLDCAPTDPTFLATINAHAIAMQAAGTIRWVIRSDLDSRFQNVNDGAFFQGDHLHWTATLCAIAAGLINTTIGP